MRNRHDSGDAAFCPSCDGPREVWFTTCPTCDFPLEIGPNAILAGQVAAPLTPRSTPIEEWIDVPISAEEPVKTALLRSFLSDQGYDFEESRRYLSIRVSDAPGIHAAISLWAYHHDLPEDHRHLDTLMSTLKEIGDVTIAAIRSVTMASTGSVSDRAQGPSDDDRDTRDRDSGNDLDLR